MKIFERAVQRQLVNYLQANNILCEEQSGFRVGHSTSTANTYVTDYILKNMDEGYLTGAVYIDLKKAFDTVDPETLLFKLECAGVKGNEHMWFYNYVHERKQQVRFQNGVSSSEAVTCGVPQGSILGPCFLFFSLTTSQTLFLNVKSICMQTIQYYYVMQKMPLKLNTN